MFEYVILIICAAIAFYKWATLYYDFFEKRGIPHEKPFPLLGNMTSIIFRRDTIFDFLIQVYNKYDTKVFGIFDQRKPLLVIKDPAIIKQITVKEFDHFMNHRPIFANDHENDDSNLFGSSLFQMKDAKWKDMRSTLSPAFTGSKMKQMFDLICAVAKETGEQIKLIPETKDGLEIDLKDYTTHFTCDVIASTAFGLHTNSIKDKDNEFFKMGRKLTTFTTWVNLKFFLFANFKPIMRLFKIELFDKDSSRYFKHLVLDAMKYRKEHGIMRPDMINMMMEARGMIESDNPKPRKWTDTELVAQCFLFFFAGFETASILMCFAAHELMENPEIQEKLYEEVAKVNGELNGQPLSYDTLKNMKYLDMVVCEALRKWPPAIAMDRVCNKDFVYEADGERIHIRQGDSVWIPAAAIHRDPKYYENPDEFDPERFREKINDTNNFTYMPFGLGPRNCIASRFAQMEAKALLYYLVRDFKFLPAQKSSIPLKLAKTGFQLKPEHGFWLKLKSRA